MVKFECHNCGHEFEKFCDDASDAIDVTCPSCKSHWTNIIFKDVGEKPLYWKLPYSDPLYPEPFIAPFPYDPIIPWPQPPWKITCPRGTYSVGDEVTYN